MTTPNEQLKKYGGIISHWQLHTLSFTPEEVKNASGYDIQTDKCYILSGTVVEDPVGRWEPGFHMKSSIICKLDLDNSIVETQNTIYKLEGDGGDDIFPDMGDAITSVFY